MCIVMFLKRIAAVFWRFSCVSVDLSSVRMREAAMPFLRHFIALLRCLRPEGPFLGDDGRLGCWSKVVPCCFQPALQHRAWFCAMHMASQYHSSLCSLRDTGDGTNHLH